MMGSLQIEGFSSSAGSRDAPEPLFAVPVPIRTSMTARRGGAHCPHQLVPLLEGLENQGPIYGPKIEGVEALVGEGLKLR